MNIIEAAQSGRRFTQVGMTKNRWYSFRGQTLYYEQYATGDLPTSEGEAILTKEQLLSDDWYLEPEVLSFTFEEIYDVIMHSEHKSYNELKKELGYK